MWSSSSSSAATADSCDTRADTSERHLGDNVGLDSNPVYSSGGLNFEQNIYPTPLTDREKASFASAEFATSIGKNDNLERPVVRVRPYIPDIADAPAAGRIEKSASDEPVKSTMPTLSGSVSKLKHMFETMSSSDKDIKVSSSSLDKSGDLPTLNVKEMVAKFGIPDCGNSSKTSDDTSCIMERKFTGRFDSGHKDEHHVVENIDGMVSKQDGDNSESSKWNPSVDNDVLSEIYANAETVMGKKESWAPGTQAEIKQTTPTSGASVLMNDQMPRNVEQCDHLRENSEFLYENDRITVESLQKNSEPEITRRETLTTQFLFGWGAENERREKDTKDLQKVQTRVETDGESSEITLNNDIICKSVDSNEIKDREIDHQATNTIQDNLTEKPIPNPTNSVLPESSKNCFCESGSEDKCSEAPEEIFISANFETEQGLESDYHIPLKISNKLEPDVIPLQSCEQETDQTIENDQRILNEENGNYFSSNGALASGVNNPGEFVTTPQETLIAPVMVSPASKFPSAGPCKERPPIVYKSLNDAICDILGDIKSETNAPHVLHEETRQANCDNICMKQSNLEQAVINSNRIVAADDLESRADTSVPSACHLPDIVQSGSHVGHDNGRQSSEHEITECSADKHSARDINLADKKDPVFIVSMKHPNVADNPSEIDRTEDRLQSGLKTEGVADSDDSDTVAEKEEMATQKSLMEMYQTLLTESASCDSPHDEVKYLIFFVVKNGSSIKKIHACDF